MSDSTKPGMTKVVPLEPTPQMLWAMQCELPEGRDTLGARILMKAVYKAMLDAAPDAALSDERIREIAHKYSLKWSVCYGETVQSIIEQAIREANEGGSE